MGATAVVDKLRWLCGIQRDSWDLIPEGGWSGKLGAVSDFRRQVVVPGSGAGGGGQVMTASQKKNAKKKAAAKKAAEERAAAVEGGGAATAVTPAAAADAVDPEKEAKKIHKKLRQIAEL
jgi:hypothetical protein